MLRVVNHLFLIYMYFMFHLCNSHRIQTAQIVWHVQVHGMHKKINIYALNNTVTAAPFPINEISKYVFYQIIKCKRTNVLQKRIS